MRSLALVFLLSLALAAEPAGSRLVELLTEACLVSSRSDCRFGVYRMAVRNAAYLEAVLTGLSSVKGVAEGKRKTAGPRRELQRLALYSLTFSGQGEEAIQAGQSMLGQSDEAWVRLAMLEGARQAWRADVVTAQLDALAKKPPTDPAALYLTRSFLAERRARLQPPDWKSAQSWHAAALPPKTWPAGSGHFLAHALAGWEEILLGAAQTDEQRRQAYALLDQDLQRFDNPEATLSERVNRLADLRAQQDWERAKTEAESLRSDLEKLATSSKAAVQSDRDRLESLGRDIAALTSANQELAGSGLELMAGNLRPNDPETGELSRLECTYYKERARLLLALPQPTPERLQQARLCLEFSAARQLLAMFTQSPLATVDPPVFDLVELELRQKTPGWEKRALDQATSAVDLFEKYASQPGLVSALACQGEVYLAQGNSTAARAALSRAVQLAEKHVSEFGYTGSWATRFRQRYAKAYELLLRLEVGENNGQAASDLLSRFQQMQLAQLRQNSLVNRATAPVLKLRGGNIQQELPPTTPSPKGSGSVVALAKGKGEFFQALGNLRQQHPEYEKLLAIRPVNYAQTQKWIPADTALVQYFPAGDSLYIFWVTRQDFKIHKVDVPADQLKRLVWNLRRTVVSDFLSKGQASREGAQQASTELYSRLVQPVEADLAAYPTVAFVPTTFLAYVPFQALGRPVEGRFRYLIEERACLTLLKSSDLEVLARPGVAAAGTLLALGNPDGSLPAATQEAEKIAGLFKGSKAYVGAAASRDKLDKLPAGTRFLHLATHGQLDSNNPTQSYLVMGKDARLSVSDIYSLALPEVRLVTLSACETGLGQSDPGSEVASLADAFEIAGARTVIASLWSVEDAATQKLMLAFYGQVKEGKSLAQSLRAAQLQLLADPQHNAPFFWAPFCLYGDWR